MRARSDPHRAVADGVPTRRALAGAGGDAPRGPRGQPSPPGGTAAGRGSLRIADGFIPVDPHSLVAGELDIYAAGDATNSPIKQGGIATQQADAAAEAIAARAGAPVEPQPFRPVLRGLLLTGATPRYMRAEVSGGQGDDSAVSEHALWWPPSKIAGRWLAPYLALRHAELEEVARRACQWTSRWPARPLRARSSPRRIRLAR